MIIGDKNENRRKIDLIAKSTTLSCPKGGGGGGGVKSNFL